MRAFRALAAVLAATFGLAACGGGSDEPPAAAPPATTDAQTTPATSPETTTTTTTTETEPAETETQPAETEPATEPATTVEQFDVDVHVEVVNGERVGGTGRVEAKKGDRVRIEVSVDAPQELHLHAYDIEKEATPDKPAVFEFTANLEGIFDLESHASEAVIVKLVVEP